MDEQLSDRQAIIARYAGEPNQLEPAVRNNTLKKSKVIKSPQRYKYYALNK